MTYVLQVVVLSVLTVVTWGWQRWVGVFFLCYSYWCEPDFGAVARREAVWVINFYDNRSTTHYNVLTGGARIVSHPSAAPKHTQARATVQILSTVRMIGTIAYAVTALAALGTVIGTFTSNDSHIAFFLGGVVVTVMIAIFGAPLYAAIGWLVETLSMLTEIARNTARPAV